MIFQLFCSFLVGGKNKNKHLPRLSVLLGRRLTPSPQPPASKMMGQPCLVSEAADIPALKVEMPLSLSAIIEWLV